MKNNCKPCKRGHTRDRFKSGGCKECGRLYQLAAYKPSRDVAHARVIRAIALLEGRVRYFTGVPCKKRHLAERLTESGGCIECSDAQQAVWRQANRKIERSRQRAWRSANRDKLITYKREWYKANAYKIGEENKAYWRANSQKRAEYSMKRHAAQLKRVPSWANLEDIAFFYDYRPAGCVVDHILPLQGKLISGLHVAGNLQWLSREENSRKFNHFVPYVVSF